MQLSPSDLDALVQSEFELMLDRCESAGVPREVARTTMHLMFTRDVLESCLSSQEKSNKAFAESPAGQAFQKAFELFGINETLRSVGVRPDETAFRAACEDYLLQAHGATLGDTLEIHGWAKPRTLKLTSFRLSFGASGCTTNAFMWFDGVPVRNCPKSRATSAHGCSLNSKVQKI